MVGQRLSGRVSKLLPFGVVAEGADGVEGVVHRRELAGAPTDAPGDGVSLGDDITVVVTGPDRQRRTVSLSQRQALPCPR
ncbi:S1 RNA-binding domain-containing protein [Streptomyces sp. NPDC087659]|uniref:S1 RNA-binding domain-containing protein n=1 Tax=Streptomyces sp. NPDC087659 TaxID=3365801 RepID=UPI00382B7F01